MGYIYNELWDIFWVDYVNIEYIFDELWDIFSMNYGIYFR